MNVIIEIAGKPEAKGRGRIGRVQPKNGAAFNTVFTPAHTRKYEAVIREHASRAMEGRLPFRQGVEVWVEARLPIPASFSREKRQAAIMKRIRPCTKPDIDNYVKSALDGINTIVIDDDNQVVLLHASKIYSEKPSLFIEVNPINCTLNEMI